MNILIAFEKLDKNVPRVLCEFDLYKLNCLRIIAQAIKLCFEGRLYPAVG